MTLKSLSTVTVIATAATMAVLALSLFTPTTTRAQKKGGGPGGTPVNMRVAVTAPPFSDDPAVPNVEFGLPLYDDDDGAGADCNREVGFSIPSKQSFGFTIGPCLQNFNLTVDGEEVEVSSGSMHWFRDKSGDLIALRFSFRLSGSKPSDDLPSQLFNIPALTPDVNGFDVPVNGSLMVLESQSKNAEIVGNVEVGTITFTPAP